MLTLKDVQHVPNLSCNLVSVSKLTQDKNCLTKCFVLTVFQVLNNGKMIGSTKEDRGLYCLDNRPESQQSSKLINSCFESFYVLNNMAASWYAFYD